MTLIDEDIKVRGRYDLKIHRQYKSFWNFKLAFYQFESFNVFQNLVYHVVSLTRILIYMKEAQFESAKLWLLSITL